MRRGDRIGARSRSLILQLGVTAALLALVAVALAGVVPGFDGRLADAAPGWIAVGVVLELSACAAYAWLFWSAFSHGAYPVGRLRAAQIGVGELAGFAITPTGAGGPALRIWALRRAGLPFRVVMTRTVVHAVALQIPYVLVALALGAGTLAGIGGGHARTPLALAPLGLVLGAGTLAMIAARLARRPTSPRSRWQRIGRDAIAAIPDGLRESRARLPREPALLAASVLYWAGDCGALVVAFTAAHGSPALGVVVLAYMLGQLGNALPLPGGVGGVEPAMLGVLTSSGVGLGLGAAAVVLYRFISLGLQALAGAVAATTLIPAASESARSGA